MNLSEYILLPRNQRQSHLDLSTPCSPKGGRGKGAMRARESLLNHIGVVNDVEDWKRARIQMCHACEHNSTNGWCKNPLHISIGTAKENISDIPHEVKRKSGIRSVELMTGIYDPAVREDNNQRMRKMIEVTRVETGESFVYEGVAVAARTLGLNTSHLSLICNGKRNHTGGYIARYV